LLLHYDWPGNVRELRSVIQGGQILCDDNEICPKDLPDNIRKADLSGAQRLQELCQQLHLPPVGVDLPAMLRDIEQTFIDEALALTNGNKVRAAALLDISRDKLRYSLQSRQQERK
jgi:two-component system NtrC family response regulator